MADEQQQLSVREQRRKNALEQLRKQEPAARVRVLPRDEDVRKFIKHFPSEIAFPESGSVEWPNDSFTQRRIADGSVTVENASRGSGDAPKQKSA